MFGTYDSCENDARAESNNTVWTSGFNKTRLYTAQLNEGACPHDVTNGANVTQ